MDDVFENQWVSKSLSIFCEKSAGGTCHELENIYLCSPVANGCSLKVKRLRE
jgi:hypothetical protein